MSYKKIGTDTGVGMAKVFKNIPIPIIKCCTGIHSKSLQHCPAFLNQDGVKQEEFSIKDPSGSWTSQYSSLARCYPLYNPQDVPAIEGNLPDKLRLTLAITTLDGTVGEETDKPAGTDLSTLQAQLTNTELLMIVTYMKMNLKDISF